MQITIGPVQLLKLFCAVMSWKHEDVDGELPPNVLSDGPCPCTQELYKLLGSMLNRAVPSIDFHCAALFQSAQNLGVATIPPSIVMAIPHRPTVSLKFHLSPLVCLLFTQCMAAMKMPRCAPPNWMKNWMLFWSSLTPACLICSSSFEV